LKYKICDNKKGIGIDNAVPSIIFIFVVTIAIVFLRINESQASDKNIEEIKKQKYILDGHSALIGYLKKLDENGSNKADFILKSYTKNDYTELKKDMEQHFASRLAHIPAWHINVNYQNNNIFYLQGGNYHSLQYNLVQADSIFIPIHGAKPEYIILQLSVGFK